MIDNALQQKAQLIRGSDLFSNSSEKCPLAEKQNLFLVLAGLKPLAFITSSHLIEVAGGAKAPEADDP